jgi:hypothetical protein
VTFLAAVGRAYVRLGAAPEVIGMTRRSPRWATSGLPLVLAALVLVAVAALVLVERREGGQPQPATSSGAASSSGLAGTWSGEGSLATCAGFADEDCKGTLSLTLTIECSGRRCVATPFDRSYGHPPLRLEDGAYAAVGPLPTDVAPACEGVPTTSGQWRLRLVEGRGRLGGTYQESTIQGFDCGATNLSWDVVLERG